MYLILKLVHVAGVVLFLGNITVGVFWKRFSDRSRNAAIMASTMDGIIAADRVFTIPGILLLLVGGFGAAFVGGIPILSTGLGPVGTDRLHSCRSGVWAALAGAAKTLRSGTRR